MKIYVASSWRNAYQQSVVKDLRFFGWKVYDYRNPIIGNLGFNWFEIDEDWEQWTPAKFINGLSDPIADRGYQYDIEALDKADVVVLVLPSGRSAHTEAGYHAGKNKPVYVFIPEPCEPELMYKMFSGIYTSMSDIIIEIKGLQSQAPPVLHDIPQTND